MLAPGFYIDADVPRFQKRREEDTASGNISIATSNEDQHIDRAKAPQALSQANIPESGIQARQSKLFERLKENKTFFHIVETDQMISTDSVEKFGRAQYIENLDGTGHFVRAGVGNNAAGAVIRATVTECESSGCDDNEVSQIPAGKPEPYHKRYVRQVEYRSEDDLSGAKSDFCGSSDVIECETRFSAPQVATISPPFRSRAHKIVEREPIMTVEEIEAHNLEAEEHTQRGKAE